MTSTAGDNRPLLLDVGGAEGPVRVTLQVRELRYVGEALAVREPDEGGSHESALVTAAARATLAALEQATPRAVTLRLEWSDVLQPESGLPALAVVLCTLTVADVPLRTPGSALLRDKPLWAGARAVLQGLNRRLEIMGL